MTYSTSNPPRPILSVPYSDGTNDLSWTLWLYIDADPTATVDGNGYFTNGQSLGMKVNDMVLLIDTNLKIASTHLVDSLSTSDDSVDLADGTTIGSTTDSD